MPEYLFRYLYDISSMSLIEGEYQCLRQIVKVGFPLRVIEQLGIDHIAISG